MPVCIPSFEEGIHGILGVLLNLPNFEVDFVTLSKISKIFIILDLCINPIGFFSFLESLKWVWTGLDGQDPRLNQPHHCRSPR